MQMRCWKCDGKQSLLWLTSMVRVDWRGMGDGCGCGCGPLEFLWTSKKPVLSNRRDRQTWQWKIMKNPPFTKAISSYKPPFFVQQFSVSHVWISGASFRKLEMEAAQQGILAAVHLQHPRRAGCLTYGTCQNVPFWMDDSWWSTMILPNEKSDFMKFTTMFWGEFDHLTWA